jgi:hypothetical protein
MALLGNYTVLNKIPLRKFSGTTESAERSNWQTSGSMRNVQLQSGQTVAFPLYGKPGGYYPNYTWMMPQIRGALGVSYGYVVGVGSITNANLAAGQYIAANLSGTGGISAAVATGVGNIIASLSGSGSIVVASGSLLAFISASMSGAGTLTGTMLSAANMSASLSGAGSLSANIAAALAVQASLSGTSAVSASGSLAGALVATLQGTSTTSGAVIGVWPMQGNLSGAATLTAALQAKGWMVSSPTGSGTITTAIPYSTGSISATIRSFSDLTPEGLASAVWAAVAAQNNVPSTMGEKLNDAGSASNPWTEVIESGYTAAEILRMMNAVITGDASGLDAAAAFKSIDGSKDRITATIAGDARTITTRDAT